VVRLASEGTCMTKEGEGRIGIASDNCKFCQSNDLIYTHGNAGGTPCAIPDERRANARHYVARTHPDNGKE
jgi:hypothetical protein